MHFQEKLMALRSERGLSQEELAQALGVSRQTVSKWELGQSYLDFQRLVALGDYFGLPLDALVRDVDVQDAGKEKENPQLSQLCDALHSARSTIATVVNVFCVIGVVGISLCLLMGILWG